MIKAKDFLKQRATEYKLLKDFMVIDKEKSLQIKDLDTAPKGVEVLEGGYKFVYPTLKQFVGSITKGDGKYDSDVPKTTLKKIQDTLSSEKLSTKATISKLENFYGTIYKKAIGLEEQLIRFEYRAKQFKREKGSPSLFIVDKLIVGNLEEVGFLRAPLIFKEAQITRKISDRTIKIGHDKYGKILINLPLFYELASKKNIPLEGYINDLSWSKDKYLDSIKEILNLFDFSYEFMNTDKKESVSFIGTQNSVAYQYQQASEMFKQTEIVRFVGGSFEEVDYTTKLSPTLTDEEHLQYLYLSNTNEELAMLDTTTVLDDDEDNEEFTRTVSEIEKLPLNWAKDANQVRKSYASFKKKSLKRREGFLSQIISVTKGITWAEYTRYMEKGKKFTDEGIELNHAMESILIKPSNILFRTEKLVDNKLSKEIKDVLDSGLIDEIEDSPHTPSSNIIKESEIQWMYNSDYSQRMAVRKALSDDSHIIQGPPGTGKTQTILNLLGHIAHTGGNALVVSEKKTAVEVIAKRFAQGDANLEPLYIELYRDDEILNAVKGLYKTIELMREDLSFVKDRNFESNKKILDAVHKFRDIADEFNFPKTFDLIDEVYKMDEKEVKAYDLGLRSKTEFEAIKLTVWNNDRVNKFLAKYKNLDIELIQKYISIKNVNPKKEAKLLVNGGKSLPVIGKKKILEDPSILEIKSELKGELLNILNGKTYNFEISEDMTSFVKKVEKIDWDSLETYITAKEQLVTLNTLNKLMNDNDFLTYENYNGQEILDNNKLEALREWRSKISKYFTNHTDERKVFEAVKDRKVVSKVVRNFFRDYWHVIEKIYPIVIGTPETISEYVPFERKKFDYAIIDEASQMFVERALPTIYRAKKIVISGDAQQLRPYKFGYKNISSDVIDGFNIDHRHWVEYDSLLDLYSHILGEKSSMLNVHYRSESFELINYSNINFYNSELSFVPVIGKKDKPVKVVYVEHDWNDQVSKNEAEEILEILEKFVKQGKKSIGVISMSDKQTKLIERYVLSNSSEKVKKELLESEEGIFIKSLNDVQGDEREHIIFSIGYDGKRASYGHINRNFGSNRLNVAASRAKKTITLVMNGRVGDFKGRHLGNDGINKFIDFLEYAKDPVVAKKNSSNHELLEKELAKKKVKDYEIISDNLFTFAAEGNKAYFLLTRETLLQTKSLLWKYIDLLRIRGYEIHPLFILADKLKELENEGLIEKTFKPKKQKDSKKKENNYW